METTSFSVFTSVSFDAAKKAAKKSPGVLFTYDAGEGFEGRAYYCTWRKRVIVETVKTVSAVTKPATVAVGDLVTVKITESFSITARVKEIDPVRGILIRETYPLHKVPADWEPANFYARPETVNA